ncbi:MAG: BRCT domain-containing protein [Verrucomicrobia bacterium]|nr:BRCT domain-containing protein [Verrucomicrobiota bacterium]
MKKYILRRPFPASESSRPRGPLNYDKAVNELLGLSKGIMADGKVTVEEVEYLRGWLERRREFIAAWPLSIVAQRIAVICVDGVITEEECKSLGETLLALTGEDESAETGQGEPKKELTTRSCFTIPEPEICFDGRSFCLTGNFVFGPKSQAEEAIIQRGGKVSDRVSREMDYLLVGSIVSKAWAHGNFGRKIEKVMTEWRHVAIISEQHWTQALNACFPVENQPWLLIKDWGHEAG